MTTSNASHKIQPQGPASFLPENSARNLANSIFESLRREGCNPKDMITVSSHLLSLVTDEIHRKSTQG